MKTQKAMIFGCLDTQLNTTEARFFQQAQPWGFILFSRNIETPAQLSALCDQLRNAVGRDAPILIDQEGGRVQRLGAPHWQEWIPPLEQNQRVAPNQRSRAMWLRYRLIAAELRALGIDVNCAPMLDVPNAQTHPIIHNRCYSDDADEIATLGRAVGDGLLAGGVLPIMKHIPGHGRGCADSHIELPIVTASAAELEIDLAPFRALRDLPMAMSAHILYPAWDKNRPATLSAPIIQMIRNDIGFDGLLMTDDLSMQALGGSYESRTRDALEAGCDIILHCNGKMEEMKAIAANTTDLRDDALRRADAALSLRDTIIPLDKDEALVQYISLLRGAD